MKKPLSSVSQKLSCSLQIHPNLPSVKKVNRTTMYRLTISPRFFAVAISARNRGAVTVKHPAPSPPKILAKSMNPYMPDEKICIKMPVPQMPMASWYVLRRPIRSLRKMAMSEPKAAPSTPKEEMFALRSARAVARPTQFALPRSKSSTKDVSLVLAEKPPSS